MGTFVGHVASGSTFFLLGFWHLINHIKLYSINPNNYKSSLWFPSSRARYLELYLTMLGTSISIATELFVAPKKHIPFDSDGTIPSNHLHNVEHSTMYLTFFTYAAFAIILDKIKPRAQYGLTHLIGAIAFAQQLLLFHLHSGYHMGISEQYHLLLQFIICVSLVTTLLGIGLPKSFFVSFVRSLSIAFQGIWFTVIGYMLWTPSLIPKGCFLHHEEGHDVVRCSSEETLHRAKSLVNIEFSCFLVGLTIFAMSLYLVLDIVYGKPVHYSKLMSKESLEDMMMEDDVESQKGRIMNLEEIKSFIHMGKVFAPNDMQR